LAERAGIEKEFKRRIKTQTVLPSAETAAMLFWSLLASGQITMRTVDGWQTLADKRAGAIESLFRRFDAVLTVKGYLAMGGQIIDATIVAAPKQKLTADEKAIIKEGGTPPGWSKAKRRHKDRDARCGAGVRLQVASNIDRRHG
jgi:hypothetical protein